MGIEPTALAWEARVLPLYDAREDSNSTLDFTVEQIAASNSGAITVVTVLILSGFTTRNMVRVNSFSDKY